MTPAKAHEGAAERLLPCPFCGGEAEHSALNAVECGCGASVQLEWEPDAPYDPIAAWNTRVPDTERTELLARVEALEGALLPLGDQRTVLAALGEQGGSDWSCLSFSTLTNDTGLDVRSVRNACRALTLKGMAEFHSGVWTEDGQPAGSGYCASSFGMTMLAALNGGSNAR